MKDEKAGKKSQVEVCCAMLSCFSRVHLFATLWTVACQPPLSMGFSRQQYWSGLPFSPPGDLPNQGLNPCFLQVSYIAGRFFTSEPPIELSQSF